MAQIQRKEVQTQIHCNEVVFYQFFMTKANLLPVVSPRNVKTIELVDGTISWDTTVGSRMLIHFGEDGAEYFKDEAIEIACQGNKITYKVLEGTMMQFYDSFQATLEVKPGTAKWTIEFQNKSESCPGPDKYFLQLLDSINKDVDCHLSPI